ncbi:MAG: hypothetical protein AB1700_13065 [Bacillota bacterium]
MGVRKPRAVAWTLSVLAFLTSVTCATAQVTPQKISNDRVDIWFPEGVAVPPEVQTVLLESITDSIQFVERFFGRSFAGPIQYVFVGGGEFWPLAVACPPRKIVDEREPPVTVEEARRYYVPYNPHEFVPLLSHEVRGDQLITSMNEGFALLVAYLYDGRPVHETAAALLGMGKLPPLRTLLTMSRSSSDFSFIVLYSGNASFLGFVYERFGRDVLMRLYENVPTYRESNISVRLFSLIEECTSIPLDDLETEWHRVLRFTKVDERAIVTLQLWEEFGHIEVFRLRQLSRHLGVHVDPAFEEELRNLGTDIDRYRRGEPLSCEELSLRTQRLREWAEEIRRQILRG